jgi:hypothetical protein
MVECLLLSWRQLGSWRQCPTRYIYSKLLSFARVQKCITIHSKTIRQADVRKTQSLPFYRAVVRVDADPRVLTTRTPDGAPRWRCRSPPRSVASGGAFRAPPASRPSSFAHARTAATSASCDSAPPPLRSSAGRSASSVDAAPRCTPTPSACAPP